MMMRFMKRLLHLGMTMLLLLSFTAATALAAETATITVNVTNTPVRGDVLLEKTGLQLVRFEDEQDAYGNTVMRPVFQNGYLAGAVFELRAAEDIVGKEGSVFYQKDELIETLTTSKAGSVKSKVLPLGKYTLTEISAPDGYVFDSTPHPFTLAAVDKQTAIVEVKVSASNTYLPVRVTLRKQKEDLLLTQTQAGMIHQTVEVYPGEGFVFGLYTGEIITYGDSQKLPANTLVATGTTDAQGNLTFSGLYPHGNYYIRELSVPDGWLLSTEKYPVTLTSANKAASENVITVYLDQPILNRLIYTPVTITKTDITGAKKLPGALIEVYDSDGNTIYREYTNENGEIPNIPVVPGTYTFKETYAPSGYALNVAVKTFTVTADGKVTARTLATAFMKFLRYSKNKVREHQNVKPQGKQSVKQLIAQNQGVENTELADRNEAKSFDRYARQYGVDYAIQKGFSQDGKPRYILYFKARDRSAINQAMAAYSVAWARQQKQERFATEPTLDPTRETPGKKVERIRQKGMER